jgi:hypothetical protein
VAGLLVVAAAFLFGGHILNGGFYSDDWPLSAQTSQPGAYGHETAPGALIDAADSRILAAFYWLATHELFGLHAKLFLAAAAGLGVVLSLAVYALLRELRLEILPAFAIAVLMLAWPPADTVRVWATPALSQVSFAAWALGALVALRAFRATGRRATYLHVASLVLYGVGLGITELPLGFVVMVSPLLYLTVAPWRAAGLRWIVDIVLAGLAATFVALPAAEAPEHAVSGVDDWAAQIKLYADQAVTLFSHAIAPFLHGARWTVFVGALVLAAAAGWVAWRDRTDAGAFARRWLAAAGIAVVAVAAGYAIYIPADPYYFPLQEGLAGRINIGVAAPYATLLVALAMLGGLLLFRWAADWRRIALTAGLAYSALLFAAFVSDLRIDLRVWDRSAEEQYRTLNVVLDAVPHPVHNTEFFVFGAGGTVSPGLSTFYHGWELTGALRTSYDRGDVLGVPIIESRGVVCDPDGVVASVVGTPEILQVTPYDGTAVFVDVNSGRSSTIRSRGQCLRVAPTYRPGPFTVPNAPAPPSQA